MYTECVCVCVRAFVCVCVCTDASSMFTILYLKYFMTHNKTNN